MHAGSIETLSTADRKRKISFGQRAISVSTFSSSTHYAPEENPNKRQKTIVPAVDLHSPKKAKINTPDKAQFGIRMTKGPYVSASHCECVTVSL